MIIDGIYDYHSGDKPFGAGWRLVVAYDRTKRKITLMCPETLKIARVPVREMRFARDLAGQVKPSRIARMTEQRRRAWKRYGIACRHDQLRAIAAALRRRSP